MLSKLNEKLNEPQGKEENVAEANLDPLRADERKRNQCEKCNKIKDAIPDHDKSQKGQKGRCGCDKNEEVPLDKRRMSDVNPTQEM